MTTADLYWLAGLLEGEGSFTFAAATVASTGYVKHNFRISVASTDLDIVERVADLLKTRVRGPYRGKAHHKQYWTTSLGARDDVLQMCRRLRPLMGQRRQGQIDAVLAAAVRYPRRRLGRPTGRSQV